MLKYSKITVWNLEVHDTLFACEWGNWSFSRFERKWRKSGHPCSLTWQMIWWCIDRTLQIDAFSLNLVWCFVAIICHDNELSSSLSWHCFDYNPPMQFDMTGDMVVHWQDTANRCVFSRFSLMLCCYYLPQLWVEFELIWISKWRKSGHLCSLTWQMIWWCIDRRLQIDAFSVDLVWCFVAITAK